MDNRKHRILFIGNSHTYFNDMPNALFEPIAKNAGYDVEVERVVKGGWTLAQHLDINSATGADVEQMLTEGKFDYVVLQEQSVRPVVETDLFFESVREFVKKIRDVGATPVLYSTWGRKTGSAKLAEIGHTSESMTYALARAYRDIGAELDVAVAHAGLAFLGVGEGIELYNPDKLHASLEGSYLAAVCLFLTIFGPVEKFYDCGICCAEQLIKSAKRAVFDTSDFSIELNK